MEYLVALTNIQNKIRGLFLLLGVCVLLVRHSGIRSYIPHEAESLQEGDGVLSWKFLGRKRRKQCRDICTDKKRLLKKSFTVTMRLHDGNLMNAHAPVAVLDEKTDGFYAIVLPGGNRIVRYDKEAGRYQFQERE